MRRTVIVGRGPSSQMAESRCVIARQPVDPAKGKVGWGGGRIQVDAALD